MTMQLKSIEIQYIIENETYTELLSKVIFHEIYWMVWKGYPVESKWKNIYEIIPIS